MELEEGYYWVREVLSKEVHEYWLSQDKKLDEYNKLEIARYDKRYGWWLTGNECEYSHCDYDVVGERLKEPEDGK